MPLRDVTSVVFDRGTGEFNEAAALEAYHLVAKMDDASASEFVFHVVNEVMENTIVANRDVLQKHLDQVVAKSLVYADLDAIADGLDADERQEVKKELLAAVSKATEAEQAAWEHRDKGGRFTSFSHPIAQGGEIDAATGKVAGVPKHPDHQKEEFTSAHAKAYRAQYIQIARALDQHDGFNGDNDVMLHYTNGETKPLLHVTPDRLAAAINPHEGENVDNVTIRPYRPALNGRVVDLTHSLGTGTQAGLKHIGTTNFADEWNKADPINSTEQMYNRVGAGSKLLAAVAPGSPKMQAAAGFGSLVGQHGSQAEQAFGPPVRRMAYRYRGTERRPAKDLVTSYGDAIHSAKSASGNFTAQENADRAPNFQEREAGREAVIAWLQKPERAPSKSLSNLQLAAGHTPPSEGVLINANGQLVTTAVGVADDWYLPFNLKHLQQLKGGEYIRSRSQGGLTTEDIYTGLMSGARKVTVVSRSGVFSVDFDNELRGGRRYNDKALRMTKHYGELLDAVQSGQVERQGLDPKDASGIRAQVQAQFPTMSPEWKRAKVKEMTKEQMDNPGEIDDELDALAAHRRDIEEDRELTPDEKRDYQAAELKLRSKKEYMWKLNGLGYDAAQNALTEQFPYYIKASSRLTAPQDAPFGSNDKGYVEPGALRPSMARANLFGGARGPEGADNNSRRQGALSARTADHARPMVDRYGDRGKPAAPEAAPAAAGGTGGAPVPKAAAKSNLSEQEQVEEALRQTEARKGAMEIYDNALGSTLHPEGKDGAKLTRDQMSPQWQALDDYRTMPRDQFEDEMRKPGAMEKFRQTYLTALRSEGAEGTRFTGRDRFEAAMGPETRGEYSFKDAVEHPGALYTFPDASDDVRAAADGMPLMLNSAYTAGDREHVTPHDLKRENEAIAIIHEHAANPAVAQGVLRKEGLYPEDKPGQGIMNALIADPEMLETYSHGVNLAANTRTKVKELPAVDAGRSTAPVTPQEQAIADDIEPKHPEGRAFTPQEKAQGWYWDNQSRSRKSIE